MINTILFTNKKQYKSRITSYKVQKGKQIEISIKFQ